VAAATLQSVTLTVTAGFLMRTYVIPMTHALSPIFRLARLTMRLLLLDHRNDGIDGSLAAGVSRSTM